MNDFLHEWKNVTLGVMSRDLPTVIEALEGSVVRAETKANVVEMTYRCHVCGEKLVPSEDMIFRDGNLFYCAFHRNPRYDKAMFCAVRGCTGAPLGTLCKEHQVEYAFGDLRFGEERNEKRF